MLDYLTIFQRLNEKRIKYIVVGGIAVNLYGIPRMTYDIDLLLDLEDENLKRFLTLLKRWRFKPRVPVPIMDFTQEKKRRTRIVKKRMKDFTLINPAWAISEIDVVINSPLDYKKAIKNVNYVTLKNISIPTISIKDLIKMKESAGRQQDKADVRYLKKIRG